jgi:hypothetical protein
MAITVSGVQQCRIALATSQAEIARFVGWVERSETHHLAARMMGIAALHPSYTRGALEERTRKFRSSD